MWTTYGDAPVVWHHQESCSLRPSQEKDASCCHQQHRSLQLRLRLLFLPLLLGSSPLILTPYSNRYWFLSFRRNSFYRNTFRGQRFMDTFNEGTNRRQCDVSWTHATATFRRQCIFSLSGLDWITGFIPFAGSVPEPSL